MLKHNARMRRAFFSNVGLVRFFRRVEQTNVFVFHSHFDLRLPSVALLCDAKKVARLVASRCSLLVMSVFRTGNCSKITPRVVVSNAVFMVDHAIMKITFHKKEGQPMCQIQSAINTYDAIAKPVGPTGNFSRSLRRAICSVSKISIFRRIYEPISKGFLSDVCHSLAFTRYSYGVQA